MQLHHRRSGNYIRHFLANHANVILCEFVLLNGAEGRIAPALVIGVDHVGADRLNLVENILLAGKADRHNQDQRGGPDHHAQGGERKADLAGSERIDRQLGDLAEEHGLSGTLQRLLERTYSFQPAMVRPLLFEFQLFGGHESTVRCWG